MKRSDEKTKMRLNERENWFSFSFNLLISFRIQNTERGVYRKPAPSRTDSSRVPGLLQLLLVYSMWKVKEETLLELQL